MKKLLSFLMIAVLGFLFVSCTDDSRDDIDSDTYSVVYDVTANFQNTNGRYVISRSFNNAIPSTDVILVYRKSGVDGNNNVWQQIPRTLFLTEGELDYDFDFTRSDVAIYAGGNVDISAQTAAWQNMYINNQTFRVVIVPAAAGKANINYSNYEEVIKYYNIDDTKVKSL